MVIKKNITLFVDVGGTETKFELLDSSLKKIKSQTLPTELPVLKYQIRTFLNKTPKPLSASIGIRGVWLPAEKSKWQSALRGLATKVEVMSDVELAHRRAFGSNPGILLIAGTGSICLGRSQTGKTVRAGGMGALIGDEGSGFWIGREYLKRVYLHKGQWPLVRRIVQDPQAVRKVAGFSKKVLAGAQRQPNSTEAKIVREAQDHLVQLVNTVQQDLKEKKLPVQFHGGLFQNIFFSDGVKRALGLFVLVFFLLNCLLQAETESLKKVANELMKGLDQQKKCQVAVLVIPQHDNRRSEGSFIISDQLTDLLAKDNKISLLERHHISQLLEELHLSQTGLFDTKTTQRIGQALGADVIVTGTLIDLNGQKTELNARGLIAENGKIIASGRSLLNRTWEGNPSLASVSVSMNRSGDNMQVLAHTLKKQLMKQKPLLLGVLNFTYAKGRISTGSALLSERLVTYLVQDGATLVERRLIESYLNEIHLAESGVLGQNVKEKSKNLLGVDAVVVGTLSDLSDDQTQVIIHVIDVNTAKVLAAADTTTPRIWLDNPRFPPRGLSSSPVPGFFAPIIPVAQEEEPHAHRLADLPSESPKRAHYYPSGVPFLFQGGLKNP